MNAVEIEEAVSKLAEAPFDAAGFPYAFLEAFGNKPTTIQRLKSGATNQSDLGGVLQRGNIHLKTCAPGEVAVTLTALRESPKTASQKAKFILATDGIELQAEALEGSGETLACEYPQFADHFGFFLPLAGISTVRQIRENAFDIKATARLNRLYIELLKDNPDWAAAARRAELNHFLARLIFCFFAEDTGIFHSERLFTATVEQMSARDASDTHEVIAELFRAMNIPVRHEGKLDNRYRQAAGIRSWANAFPYVNGGLFGTGAGAGARMPPSASPSASPSPSPHHNNPTQLSWHNRGYLPHLDDLTKIQHITFRLADSLPEEVLKQLETELEQLPIEQRESERREKIDAWIDNGLGCCALGHPECAKIVQDSLTHADGRQYHLLAWCIMPNHVHVLIQPLDQLGVIVKAWKSVSARKILALNENLALGIPDSHTLWQPEYWDRYMRDDHHLRTCMDYIQQNPVKAGLVDRAEAWKWSGARKLSPVLSNADEGIRAPDVPRFSKIARSYLLHIGNLDWTKINPDIFGSMIQAVADDEERGALGMHYTSVPNILKVLNPLFLDDLRAKLEEAGDSPQKLLNLRKRLARIRVFDPACGSGNFLVIAYKEMRAIEAEINRRRDEAEIKSVIPKTNFRGVEIKSFSCEIARLALIIAEYQCDVVYRGEQLALAEFLPLEKANWITCGNALRLDWLSICPPTGTTVKNRAEDLFETPLDQSEIDFENEGGETYICGNPPYLGSKWQTSEHKADLSAIFANRTKSWKSLDYVAGWFMKAADYGTHTNSAAAFVSTNSICQGQQVPILWPTIFETGHDIFFAHTSFKWANLASHNAGVTVVIVGISRLAVKTRKQFSLGDSGETVLREVPNINAYLVASENVQVEPSSKPVSALAVMQFGNHPYYGAELIFSVAEAQEMTASHPEAARFVRPLYGSKEFISATPRACLWIEDADQQQAASITPIAHRMKLVSNSRLAAKQDKAAQKLAETPYRFRDQFVAASHNIVVPRVSSENRPYLPVGLLSSKAIVQDQILALYDAPLWNMAIIASRLHLVWIGTVCGKLETRYRYSNTLGWNTFPVPTLTEQNKADLTRCAENILLAREAHFPATIADLYGSAGASTRNGSEEVADEGVRAPGMPANLRAAHERNDETLERIYLGRRFKNDTERLEKLFELYTKMTTTTPAAKKAAKKAAKRKPEN